MQNWVWRDQWCTSSAYADIDDLSWSLYTHSSVDARAKHTREIMEALSAKKQAEGMISMICTMCMIYKICIMCMIYKICTICIICMMCMIYKISTICII